MSGLSNVDHRHRLSVDTPPPPIPKDMQGSDSSVPLSPQWLLPKLGDNKLGLAAREPHPQVSKHSDPAKSPGNVEDLSVTEKRKDVYRPSFYDTEKGRRDHWGDEEREANYVNRRDLRREGEELGDSRKLERWPNTASRYSGEARRFPSERRTDSGSRESAYEPRRESKWNTRWGPDDKDSENWREKWSGKDGETSNDKSTYHPTIHAKDINSQGKDTDKEGEHYRLWRSSLAVNRVKGENSPYLTSTTNKPAPMFSYGRGKGDTGASAFSVDRGRVGLNANYVSGVSGRHFPSGTASDRSNDNHRDAHILRYSRMKLLDICRTTDLKGYRMSFEWFQEFPSLMLADPLMPLSLIAPSAEELFILEAIDKGDILSSGAPLASKDGSSGKNSVDSGLLIPTKSGIGEDVARDVSDKKDERTGYRNKYQSFYVEGASYDKCSLGFDSEVPLGESLCQSQEVLNTEASKFEVPDNKVYDLSKGEASKVENTIPCGSQSVRVGSLWSSNDLLALTEDRSGSPGMGWLNTRKDMVIEQRNRPADSSSYLRGDPQWQDTVNLQSDVRTESRIRRQPSETSEQEGEGLVRVHGQNDPFNFRDKLSEIKPQQYLSPEYLSLFYKDPQGQIQGPFCGTNLIEWFDAGYFGIDLLVRLASAPADTPFSLLGDVIPQLRTRVRPPPGFGSARQNDSVEVPNRGNFGGTGGIHAGISDLGLMRNGQVLRPDLKVKAENQFLESLMSGRISNPLSDNYSLSEGMQGYNGLSGGRPSLGIENANDMKYLLQKMPLEQQSPLLSPYRLVGESPAILPKPDAIGEFQIPPKIPPKIGEVPHHIPQSLQHMDLLSILQSAADRTPPPPINSALPLWPNFPEVQSLKSTHGSLDMMKDALELHSNQQNSSQTGFGTLPKRLQPQFQPPLASQTPVGSHSSGVIPPEKLFTSEFSQDAQMVNLLRQQYMLSQQLHSQVPLPSHVNQMELLLLMQRQQEEQQQNQLLMQQQQHFLSQPLPGLHSYKHNNELSFSPISAEVVNENASLQSTIHQMHDVIAQSNRQMQMVDSNDSCASGLSNLNLHGAQEASITDGIEHSQQNLPIQLIKLAPHSNAMDAPPLLDVVPAQTSNIDQTASMPIVKSAGEGHAKEAFVPQLNSIGVGTSDLSQELPLTIASDAVNNYVLSDEGEGILDSKLSVSEMIDDVKISHGTISEQVRGEAPELKGVRDAEQSEIKKVSEKKPRKHKTSQLRAAAEGGKGSVKAPGQKSIANYEFGGIEKGAIEAAETRYRTTLETGGENCATFLLESVDSHGSLLSSGALDKKTKVEEKKVNEGEFVMTLSHNQAWKPAPGQKKTKPLPEIQVEEQRRAQTQSLVANTVPEIIPADVSAAPLTVGSINSGQKYAVDTVQCDGLVQSISENTENRQNPWNLRNISQLPDVLDKEILPELLGGKDQICSEEKGTSSHTLPQIGAEIEAGLDNGDFIEAKGTRRSRKRAAKNKSLATKASLPSNSAAVSVSASAAEQTKATRQTQQDNDLLPSPPAAPSFGDFVFWKGDQESAVPSPAWSTDSVKIQKPAFLRDIFKEQDEKKTKSSQQQTPIPTQTKIQNSKGSEGNSSSVLVLGSSPSKNTVSINSKTASSTQTSSLVLGQHKTGIEDDFFWGPLDRSKEGCRSDFPSLANPSGQKVKATPVKGAYGEGSSKKASSSKPVENSITSSPSISRSLSKGKKDTESINSEAIDFRNWCEGEWFKLTRTNDTSFLQFCLKQPTAEAAVLLRENLTSLDHDHEFIDKFINYKEFLSSEIIEMAFQSRKSSKAKDEKQSQASHGTRIPRNLDAEIDDGVEGSSKGKKKGKKGKKVSPTLLGFNVVSNRIMMGEIQTIED
ncbi:hypothetical protein KFK09_004617 [Dendrobium nobile]|uniref:GYF domain-containing protein n=1 Tax=Dendrobium nobile TaxID=94219 RepID=A0A8T3C3C1_DENNO|nr:hypothetical protein KFK09_004617 [Dendrobium nobile]